LAINDGRRSHPKSEKGRCDLHIVDEK